MIYITGDTHGDLGLCWERDKTFEYNCDFFATKAFTLLWVQGNHENYNMIEEYPLEEWHGGMVRHIVRDKVILLERGQVFELEGKKFFTFGGASSHDIQGGVLNRNDCDYDDQRIKAIRSGLPFRILNESWWKQELPTEAEMAEGMKNLQRHDYKVDYVISHCCATGVQNILDKGPGRPRFRLGEYVVFGSGKEEKQGKIMGVDPFGTFEQNEEPSYDVYVEEENCIYKHIMESAVRKAT